MQAVGFKDGRCIGFGGSLPFSKLNPYWPFSFEMTVVFAGSFLGLHVRTAEGIKSLRHGLPGS